MNQTSSDDLQQTISKLWNESFHGLLSTHSLKFADYPFGSLLPICRDSQGNPLILISHLAQHTRNLDSNPHCSLTLTQPTHADVLQWPRLNCLLDAESTSSSNALERYCRYYPEGRRYQKELNFKLYRLVPKQVYFIAGFGSARWFDVSRVLKAPRFHTAAELEILYQLNAREHTLLVSLLESRGVQVPNQVKAVGADPQGLDIRLGETLTRLHLLTPITDETGFVAQVESTVSGQ